MKVLINGGKSEIVSATIPVEWRFSEGDLEKKPTQILIFEQNETEKNDEYRSPNYGRRYVCPVVNAVFYLQLFSPGYHRIMVLAIDGSDEDGNGFIKSRLEQGSRDIYNLPIDWEMAEPGKYSLPIVAAQIVEFRIPEQGLFAERPRGWFGQFVWDWVNRWFDYPPRDECQFRRRMIFAFTLQPPMFLVGMFFKYLFSGLIVVPYILLASLTVLFFGYRPKPLQLTAAFFYDRDDLDVTKYRKHKLWRRERGPLGDKNVYLPITPFEITALIAPFCLWYFFSKYVGTALFWLAMTMLGIAFFVVFLPMCWSLATKLDLTASSDQLERRRKRQEKIQQEEKDRRARFEEEYQNWLRRSFGLNRPAADGDIFALPKPRSVTGRVVQVFQVGFNVLKAKVCRPYPR